MPERIEDVDYILQTIDRNPCFIDSERDYIEYLGNAAIPQLLTDDRQRLVAKLHTEFPQMEFNQDVDISVLKDLLADFTEQRKTDTLRRQVAEMKNYRLYDDIQNTFKHIVKK